MLLNRTDEIHESTEGHFVPDAYDPQSHSNPKRLGCRLLGDHSAELDAPLRPASRSASAIAGRENRPILCPFERAWSGHSLARVSMGSLLI